MLHAAACATVAAAAAAMCNTRVIGGFPAHTVSSRVAPTQGQ